MRDYTRTLMREAHEKGTPVMRTLFYEFPEDIKCWSIEDEYMYGGDYLVAPILEKGARIRKVYLPEGTSWKSMGDEQIYEGGKWIEVTAPLSLIPVFQRCY